jgi:hypothetical protein
VNVRRVALGRPGRLLAAGWVIVLAASLLPAIVLQELAGIEVGLGGRALGSVLVVAAGVLATVVIPSLHPLRPLLAVLLVIVPGQWVAFRLIGELPPVRARLASPAFAESMPAEVLLNALVTVAIVALLLALTRNRQACFLARGDVAAPAEPVRWLGIGRGDRWSTVGPIATAAVSGGTLAFLLLSGAPSAGLLGAAAAVLPAILFAAAVNALNEEIAWKASILAVLEGPLGRRDALRLVAAHFGIAHFYGVPYGLVGVALAWFLGWLLARSMVETRGLWWAWLIHFVQDVLIFAFLAATAIVPGGA